MKQKNPFKHLLLLSILLAASLPAFSQHFDWVKTFVGQDVNHQRFNEIVGSVVDSEGNLYILGHFGPGADMDGMNLLPSVLSRLPRWMVRVATPSPGQTARASSCPSLDIVQTEILEVAALP